MGAAAITACTIALTAAREALRKQLSHMHTREYARRPDDLHVGPMVCMWAAPPTCMSSGLRAYQGVNTNVQGLRRKEHATPGIVVPKSQTTSAKTM